MLAALGLVGSFWMVLVLLVVWGLSSRPTRLSGRHT